MPLPVHHVSLAEAVSGEILIKAKGIWGFFGHLIRREKPLIFFAAICSQILVPGIITICYAGPGIFISLFKLNCTF